MPYQQASNSGPNKRLNGPDGRARNTSTSNAARRPGEIQRHGEKTKGPSIPGTGTDFAGAASLTGQMAGAYAQFQNLAAAYRQKRVGIKAGLVADKARIRTEAVGAMSEAIGATTEAGMTGSSAAAQTRIGIMAGRRADISTARNEAREAAGETRIGEQQAFLDYTMAEQQMEMQAEAMRQQAALAQQALDAQAQQSSDLMSYIQSQAEGGGATGPSKPFTVNGIAFEPKRLASGKFQIDVPGFAGGGAPIVFDPNKASVGSIRAQIKALMARTQGTIQARIDAGRM